MPGYGRSTARHRIYLTEFDGSNEWFEIPKVRTLDQLALLEEAGLNAATLAVKQVMQLAGAICREFILAWSLMAEESDAEPMPISEHTFTQVLDDAPAVWIIKQILAYYDRSRLSEESLGESNGRLSAPSRPAAISRR